MKKLFLLTTILILVSVLPASAYSPMEYFNSLVAGIGKGFKDGEFNKAKFNEPSGMTFDDEGKRLFVADLRNNRIRVIDMDHQNRVETLAGNGNAAEKDGSLLDASFNEPWDLTYVPQNRLIVYDNGTHTIREIDLNTKTVKTLTTVGGNGLWNLAYRAQDNSLYYTDVYAGTITRLDLKTLKTSVFLHDNPLLPHPKTLKIFNGKLYSADAFNLYEIQIDDKNPASTPTLALVTKFAGIEALAFTDGSIYALGGPGALTQLTPETRPVTFMTPWSFMAPFNDGQAEEMLTAGADKMYGFACSPREPRKFYVAGSGYSIRSFKDYAFGATWKGDSREFDYPALKPPKTYRILMVGDSRLITCPVLSAKDISPYIRVNTYSKQLEFMLNLEASRNNVDMHYEVLMLGHINANALLFGNYEVADTVKKYDIDTVFLMASLNYQDYFYKPITPEGIPAQNEDSEFLAKPITQRIPTGPAGQLYQDSEKKGLLKITTIMDYSLLANVDDPQVRNDLNGMFGHPLDLLTQKVNAIRLKNGSTPKIILGYFPWDQLPLSDESYESFWKDMSQRYGVTYLSITEGFNTLRDAFAPVEQECCAHHYTTYGHLLIAYLLGHALIDQKLIPFEPKR
jgi:hypothetical protein